MDMKNKTTSVRVAEMAKQCYLQGIDPVRVLADALTEKSRFESLIREALEEAEDHPSCCRDHQILSEI